MNPLVDWNVKYTGSTGTQVFSKGEISRCGQQILKVRMQAMLLFVNVASALCSHHRLWKLCMGLASDRSGRSTQEMCSLLVTDTC